MKVTDSDINTDPPPTEIYSSHHSLAPDMNRDEEEEKQRLIGQVLELQNTLDDLSVRVDSVKEENLKLKSENQVLGQYIENLMSASSVFQSTSPAKSKKKPNNTTTTAATTSSSSSSAAASAVAAAMAAATAGAGGGGGGGPGGAGAGHRGGGGGALTPTSVGGTPVAELWAAEK